MLRFDAVSFWRTCRAVAPKQQCGSRIGNPPIAVDHRTIRANLAWTIFGRVTVAAANWLLLVLIAKFTNRTEVGSFALAVALATPVMMASRLHLRFVLATDYRREYSINSYISTTTVAMLLGFVVLLVVLTKLCSGDVFRLSLIYAAYLAIEAFCELAYGVLQRAERMDLVGRSLALRGIGSLLVTAMIFAWTPSTQLAIVGVALVAAFVLLVHDGPYAWHLSSNGTVSEPAVSENGYLSPPIAAVGSLALRGAPLAATVFVLALDNNVPRYFIEPYCGISELALFAAVCSLIGFSGIISTAIAQNLLPRMSRFYWSGKISAYRSLVVNAALLNAVCGCLLFFGVVTFGNTVLAIAFTPDYTVENGLLVVLGVWGAAAFVGSIFGPAVIAMRRFWVPLPVNALSLLIIAVFCAITVPRWGMIGAAIAMIGATVFRSIAFGWIVLRATSNIRDIGD